MTPLRIGFAGTPEFAATIYKNLLSSGFTIDRVFTQPPRRSGRGKKVKSSPVHEHALIAQAEVFTPTRLKDAEQQFDDLDVLVVAAYGLILPKTVLAAPTHGCINVHASLLPRWRGASPIEHAILHGDSRTGISIMKIEARLDSGPIYSQRLLELNGNETLDSLTHELSQMGAIELTNVLEKLQKHELPDPVPQDEAQATFAPRLVSSDAKIDWSNSATDIERRIRAFIGRGGAYTLVNNTRLQVQQARVVRGTLPTGVLHSRDGEWLIGCGEACLALDIVQLNRGSGKSMNVNAAANGYRDVFRDGTVFESP